MQLLAQTEPLFTQKTKQFYDFHKIQLNRCGFPLHLIQLLHQKLQNNVYDVGDSFKIMDNQDDNMFFIQSLKDHNRQQSIWILDHLVTFRYTELRSKLENNPGVLERLKQMTKYLGDNLIFQKEDIIHDTLCVEMDSQELESVSSISIPQETVCLSLVDNKLTNPQQLITILHRLNNLRVLWINGNPIQHNETLKQYINQSKTIELYNSKLTPNSSEWIFKYLITKNVQKANALKTQDVYTIDLSGRQVFNIKIQILNNFKNLHVLNIKQTTLNNQSQLNKLKLILQLQSIREIKCDFDLEREIYRVFQEGNHKINRQLLINGHNLYMPVPTLLEAEIDTIQQRIFKLAGSYRLIKDNQYDETSVFYINDQVGSAFTHSDHPQCKIAPFLYAPNRKMDSFVQTFTLMWLCKDVKEGDVVERDFLNAIGQDMQRSSKLARWYQVPKNIYINLYKQYTQSLQNTASSFKPYINKQNNFIPTIKEKYKVMTDNPLLKEFLTLKQFQFTQSANEADLFWMEEDIQKSPQIMQNIKRGALANQFDNEKCLVTKDGLANTIQSTLGRTKFYQRTYDLKSQLPIFLGHFFQNQRQGLDNLWINKPPDMARSVDMLVTDNLNIILSNMQTGPKLAQKYITNPVKRLNRKIDLRFIVAAKSLNPLNVYIYKHFWIRTSNNQYNIDCRFRQEYQTHFTVMNYGKKLTQVHYPDFIEQFNKDYKPIEWSIVYDRIKQLLRQTFLAVQSKYPQMHSNNRRAYYGADIMIDQTTMEPKLLQFTFSPDCKRACKFYPSFYNDLFEVLFLERDNSNVQQLFKQNQN